MSKKSAFVAIVGRTNVGKSSLFNTIIGRRQAIVAKQAGTTRDRITAKASYNNKDFWLVDTAGMKSAEDDFELGIQEQIAEAAHSADVIIVVAEADTQVSIEDRQVATMALKSRKPVILAVNKSDKNSKLDLGQWQTLGIANIVATSTTQKLGIEELLELVSEHLPNNRIPEADDRLHIAILGRPNVGKSSLFNSLAAKQQALVAKQAGTTRDVNRLYINYHGQEIELADTAGIRRSGKIEPGVEKFSVLRALTAIEQSDICLTVMDVTEPNTQLDQKIAGLIKESGKGLIIVANKWDEIKEEVEQAEIASRIKQAFPFVPWAPLIFTSATQGHNVTKIFDLALEIYEARKQKFRTTELNRWLRQTVDNHEPPPTHNALPKLNYMVQEEDIDMPSFKIFGSSIRVLHFSYRRYLEKQFRSQWPLIGTPLKFWFIDKKSIDKKSKLK